MTKHLAVNEDVRFNLDFLHFSHISPAICCLPGVYYRQHDEIAGSLSRSLRADLLDAEAGNRPALARLLAGAGWPPAGREALLRQSRVQAALNQYDLLTGRPGRMPLSARRALFRRIFADAEARAALLGRLRTDPHRLAALPYRFCLGPAPARGAGRVYRLQKPASGRAAARLSRRAPVFFRRSGPAALQKSRKTGKLVSRGVSPCR